MDNIKQDEKNIQRNPPWTREELILALDMYYKVKNVNKLSSNSPEVTDLSGVLRQLNLCHVTEQSDTYRNPSGVLMKLLNFYSIEHPGNGLKNSGKLDKKIFEQYQNNKDLLERLASQIRNAILHSQKIEQHFDDEEFPEGRLLEKQHKTRERNKSLIRKKKERALLELGVLECEVCGFNFGEMYGELGENYIECHHIVPLSSNKTQKNAKISDLALVCANCHRMLHRARPWLTITELKKRIISEHRN